MSGLTNYLTVSGVDLSYVFMRGTNPTNSGYKLTGLGGGDLSSIFKIVTSGGPYVTETGYLNSSSQDISRMYEPYSPTILNHNFILQTANASPYYLIGSITNWTSQQTYVGYSTLSPFNTVSLPSPYNQFCALQRDGASISQEIDLQKLSYTLSFYIIGRNQSGSASYFQQAITSISVLINSTIIFTTATNVSVTTWVQYSTSFTANGITTLQFRVSVNNSSDSSILITGIVLRVS